MENRPDAGMLRGQDREMTFLKNYFLPLLMLTGFCTVLILVVLNPVAPPGRGQPQEHIVIKQENGQLLSYRIELAMTPEQLRTGLMNRESLPEGLGMLFLFPGDDERGFWMKNTLIPLDMVFIKADGAIHRIHSMARPHDETIIPSEGPVRAVLEVKGGEMAKYGVKPGDVVHYSAFGNMPE